MKISLLYPDRNFPWDRVLDVHQQAALEDLELEQLLRAMAGEDKLCHQVCRQVLLTPAEQEDVVLYRQEVLRDCLDLPWILQELQALLLRLKTKIGEIHQVGLLMEYPSSTVSYGADKLELQLEELKTLRTLADRIGSAASARGWQAFAACMARELTEDFFREAEDHLKHCRFKRGSAAAITLGPGLKPAVSYPVRVEPNRLTELKRKLLEREESYVFAISEQDQNGMKAFSEMQQKTLNQVGNVLMQAASHVGGFFEALERELAFYGGCVRLHGVLEALGCGTVFPTAGPWQYRGLYDGALTLQKHEPVVPNSHDLAKTPCVLVTGANQGGKTTWLRSVGQAALMARCGMFVCAESMHCPLTGGVFTHFRREEDSTMKSGKLDEELERMDQIVSALRPGSCLLMNESFAATNEQDGSEIAWQVMQALLDQGVQVFCVTHFYELAERFLSQKDRTRFLRACRRPDGSRTYRLEEGSPAATGHGRDLYERVFPKEP